MIILGYKTFLFKVMFFFTLLIVFFFFLKAHKDGMKRSVCGPDLLIKLIHDALCPFEVKVADLGWSIDICYLNTHLAHKKSVILIGPINSRTVDVIHLKDGRIFLE